MLQKSADINSGKFKYPDTSDDNRNSSINGSLNAKHTYTHKVFLD